MRKVIAAINMTLDGFCDHTSMVADDEIHQHYTDLLRNADIAIWGRKTFELMEYWKAVVADPTGVKTMDDFATAIDDISKIVYSKTLTGSDWRKTVVKREIVRDEILELKEQPGNAIVVGSPGLIVAFANLGVVDEFQLSIQPTIAGSGLHLLKDIGNKIDLKLAGTKVFGCGVVTHYYESKPSAANEA
ncbi:MAG TPA: dihydrofolate reductase family protein [Pyrinomonadaceae bacterium]|nr:dihydrofolate reductase family protein [Pyrinomonadaceae bacterium]